MQPGVDPLEDRPGRWRATAETSAARRAAYVRVTRAWWADSAPDAMNSASASPVASLTTSPRDSSSTRSGSRSRTGGATHATRSDGATSLDAVPM